MNDDNLIRLLGNKTVLADAKTQNSHDFLENEIILSQGKVAKAFQLSLAIDFV